MGRPDEAEATGRFCARLVAVVAVVAGLVVLIAPLCGDGMVMMPVAGVGSAHDQGQVAAIGGSTCHAMVPPVDTETGCGPDTGSWLSPPVESPVPGGVLLACIGLVIAILAVVLGVLPGRTTGVALVRRSWGPGPPVVRRTRPATLAELCVLRT